MTIKEVKRNWLCCQIKDLERTKGYNLTVIALHLQVQEEHLRQALDGQLPVTDKLIQHFCDKYGIRDFTLPFNHVRLYLRNQWIIFDESVIVEVSLPIVPSPGDFFVISEKTRNSFEYAIVSHHLEDKYKDYGSIMENAYGRKVFSFLANLKISRIRYSQDSGYDFDIELEPQYKLR